MILSSKRMCILKLVAKSSYLHLKVVNQISSKKFHELSEKFDLAEMINPIPEDNILSKYLSDTLSFQKPKPSSTATSTSKKTHLPYAQTLEKNPHGSIVSKKYKDTEFLMIGMNYQNLGYSQLFKTIMKFEPDCIMVQARPELFNKEFNIMKKGEDGVFSDRLYVQQLQVSKAWNILSPQHIASAQSLIFPRKSQNHTHNMQPTLHPSLPFQPLPLKPLLTSLYYSTKSPTPTYLSQLPELISRQHIASSNSLMQLQELFKQVAKSMALYPGVPVTPLKLGMYMFPDVFMRKNDLYQATLVEILIAMRKFKKILVLNGQAENQVIAHILENDLLVDQNQDITPLLTQLLPAPIKSSLLRQFQPLELLEKHIIFDTLYYGHKSTTVPISSLTTTNKVIAQYLSKQPKQLIFKFRYEMMLKYSELLKEYQDKGKNLKKKQFVRAALKN